MIKPFIELNLHHVVVCKECSVVFHSPFNNLRKKYKDICVRCKEEIQNEEAQTKRG